MRLNTDWAIGLISVYALGLDARNCCPYFRPPSVSLVVHIRAYWDSCAAALAAIKNVHTLHNHLEGLCLVVALGDDARTGGWMNNIMMMILHTVGNCTHSMRKRCLRP